MLLFSWVQLLSLFESLKMCESNRSMNDARKNNIVCVPRPYCKFGNFRENLIFAYSVKRHICDVKNLRLRYDLPISVNDRVILPFREDLISRNFAYAKFREYKTLAKISEFTVSIHCHCGYR